jgi:penicillin-insensitive murein endopeptidase
MNKLPLIFVLLVLSLSAVAQDSKSEPVGYYSDGQLRNGVSVPDEGPGFMHLFLHRKRGFGAHEMIDMLVKSAGFMEKKFPDNDRLQIGDIAQEGGGPVADLHGSHQNGLDADLTYFRKDKVEQPASHINGFQEIMVVRGKLSKNFDTARVWEFIKSLHANGKVQRIFMDPLIKKELCRYATLQKEVKSHEEVLRSVRPYPNHADHMHVRLRCPSDAKDCRAQEDPPPGSGCSRKR